MNTEEGAILFVYAPCCSKVREEFGMGIGLDRKAYLPVSLVPSSYFHSDFRSGGKYPSRAEGGMFPYFPISIISLFPYFHFDFRSGGKYPSRAEVGMEIGTGYEVVSSAATLPRAAAIFAEVGLGRDYSRGGRTRS